MHYAFSFKHNCGGSEVGAQISIEFSYIGKTMQLLLLEDSARVRLIAQDTPPHPSPAGGHKQEQS